VFPYDRGTGCISPRSSHARAQDQRQVKEGSCHGEQVLAAEEEKDRVRKPNSERSWDEPIPVWVGNDAVNKEGACDLERGLTRKVQEVGGAWTDPARREE
jgi:hypothetical protein